MCTQMKYTLTACRLSYLQKYCLADCYWEKKLFVDVLHKKWHISLGGGDHDLWVVMGSITGCAYSDIHFCISIITNFMEQSPWEAEGPLLCPQ